MVLNPLQSLRKVPPAKSKFQILSDLHLEIFQQYTPSEASTSFNFEAVAPFLILAGDIGRLIDFDGYLSFLQEQVKRYEKVFLVLGNHEFYGLDHATGVEEAHRLCNDPSLAEKVVLLDKTRWDHPSSDLVILGCTLWSFIPEESCTVVAANVSDFKHIKGWDCDQHNDVHTREKAWLQEQVSQIERESATGKVKDILIVTHHAPCLEGTSHPEHAGSQWSSAFATNLLGSSREARKEWPGVKVWVFGHTHYTTDMMRSGIRLVANQRGYVFPNKKEGKAREKKRKPQDNNKTTLFGFRKDTHTFDAEKILII